MAIDNFNKIDVKTDDLTVIEAKVKKLKELLSEGKVTQEEYDAEKDRVESDLKLMRKDKEIKFGYAFNW